MSVTADIGAYLQTAGIGIYTEGTTKTIYENEMPNEPIDAISLYEYAGASPPLSWNGEYAKVQARVRAVLLTNAQTTAYAIFKALHKLTNVTMNGHLYHYISADHRPASLGRDQRGRHLFVVNFSITKETE